jgi:CheY-like chemotaxis protein
MKTILFVEDDEIALKYSCLMIKKLNKFTVLPAQTAVQALDICKTQKIDCVFLDLGLPDIDGLNVLKAIKALDSAIKVYVVTGCSESDIKERCFAAGADKFIPKPIDIAAFQQILLEL